MNKTVIHIRTLLFLLLIFCQYALSAQTSSQSQQAFHISHGPYLHEVTTDGATFAFQTSQPSFSFIELKKEAEEHSNNYAGSQHGLKQADATFFAIRAEELRITTQHDLPIPHTCQRNQIIPTVQGGIRRQHRFALVHIPYH